MLTTSTARRVLLAVLVALPAACARGPSAAGAGGRDAATGAPVAPLAVVSAVVGREPFVSELEALGTARAREAVDITSKLPNLITAIRFTEGQRVAAGVVLVELDGHQARAELAAAEATLADSRAQAARARALAASAALSAAQVDQLEATLKANEARAAAARARLADTVIRAPFTGRTGLRRVSVGSLVNPGTVITTLDDTSVIKLDFAVPESAVGLLAPGLAVAARSVAFADREFGGRVESVDSRVDPVTRAVQVRALLPNGDGALKPGMFLTVRLRHGAVDALLVPEAAIVPEQGQAFVFVVRDGVVERRPVELGRRRPGRVEVRGGLAVGERVVVEGTLRLRDGSAVREAASAEPAAGTAPAKG